MNNEEDPNNIGIEDDFSFSSISSATVTASSQISARSIKIESDVKVLSRRNNFAEVLEKLFKDLEKLPKGDANIMKEIKESTSYLKNALEEIKLKPDVSESKSVELESFLKMMKITNAELNMKVTKQQSLVQANESLNEYISEIERHYQKEMGALKAKLSLTRLEKEIKSNRSLTQNDSVNETVASSKQKRRRSGSILFWKKNSKKENSGDIVHNVNDSDISKLLEHTLQNELEERFIEIEKLKSQCNELQTTVAAYEENIQGKGIEISKLQKRNMELSKQCKKLNDDSGYFSRILDSSNNILRTISSEVEIIKQKITKNRNVIATHGEHLKSIHWNINALSEENKILMRKVNKQSSELITEKELNMSNHHQFKGFLVDICLKLPFCSNSKFAHSQLLEQDTKDLMLFIKNNTHFKSKDTLSKEIQTIHFEQSGRSETVHHQTQTSSPETFSSKSQHSTSANRGRSSSRGSSPLTNKGSPENCCRYGPGSPEFFEQVIAYVEYMKNKEIDTYRQDASYLERENMQLRNSLYSATQEVDKLKMELQYRNCISTSHPYTSSHIDKLVQQSRHPPAARLVRYGETPGHVNKNSAIPKYCRQSFPNTDRFAHPPQIEKPDTAVDPDSSFLHSFNKGSTLIEDIFAEKSQLECELANSRKLTKSKKRSINK